MCLRRPFWVNNVGHVAFIIQCPSNFWTAQQKKDRGSLPKAYSQYFNLQVIISFGVQSQNNKSYIASCKQDNFYFLRTKLWYSRTYVKNTHYCVHWSISLPAHNVTCWFTSLKGHQEGRWTLGKDSKELWGILTCRWSLWSTACRHKWPNNSMTRRSKRYREKQTRLRKTHCLHALSS